MDIFNYTIRDSEEIIKEFNSNLENGLNEEEAKNRLVKYGKNILKSKEIKWWNVLFRQFKSVFVYLLFAAGLITFVLGEYIDSSMILLFIIINSSLGFFQEYHSEKTMQLLKQSITSYVKTIRNGKIKMICSEYLVPGDIIILETGDKIPADVRFIEIDNLLVDETVLTGESIPVYKKTEKLLQKISTYYKALNIGFLSTSIVKGKAKALIIATGDNASVGHIAKLTNKIKRVSAFEKNISHFANLIFKFVSLTLVIVFLGNFLIKGNELDTINLLIFCVALTIGVIPEALPLVTTFSLSRSAKRLAADKVIVKRLSSVEDLGGIEILCSDKTGTLTENELTVAEIYSSHPQETFLYANLAAAFEQEKKTEPFDIALWKKVDKKQIELINDYQKLSEIPFDPKIKRNIVLLNNKNNSDQILITRGAPEEIVKLCLNVDRQNEINQWIANEGKQGRRVLAIAKKNNLKKVKENNFEKESDFEFLGVISFVDTIKKSAYEITKQANKLGVKIKIITGDNAEVAGAVAFDIGLIETSEKVITGDEWNNLNEKQKINMALEHSVFARFSPEQKYDLIEKLQLKHSVGFLGEGINDVPVLKIVGVSLVVENGSDIAKETADIILLTKNLKVILDGIEEGRRVFANTIKYLKVTLSSNFGNFFAIAIASFLIPFLPMLPLQILLLNLLSDFPMIAISTDSVEQSELQSPKKYDIKDIIIFSTILGGLSAIFDFIFFGLFYKISPGVLQTNWFIASVLTELALIFSVRTKLMFIKGKKPSSALLWLSLMAVLIAIALPFTSFGVNVFNFVRPTITHLAIIIFLVIIYFIFSEILKLIYYKKINNSIEIVNK
ncbi:MAG: HAD-IC family P-type ATPase [Candidatus Kuenenbacteria bacterium]